MSQNVHMGAVIVHHFAETEPALVEQSLATSLGWDGESPVMFIDADGSVRNVCPGREA